MTTTGSAEGASRAALVTGCSSGIGRATALRLNERGWSVVATTRSGTDAELSAGGCTVVALDVTDPAGCQRVVAGIEAVHGAVTVLVNNAGYGVQGPFESIGLDDARRQLETNVLGPATLCRLVLPGMRRQAYGRIVNVSSMGGRLTFPGGAWYHASKFALEGLSDVLRWEVAPFGVGVVVVEPGPVLSAFGTTSLATLGSPADTEAPYAAFAASIEAGLRGTFETPAPGVAVTPDDVATAIADAVDAGHPPSRIVVGETAVQLLAARAASSDEQWDALCDGMFQRPDPSA